MIMGLNWDFTNYTFSFLVSLTGVILGICYPLFLENIRKIDDQYNSTVLSKLFQDIKEFNVYRVALLLSLILSFLAPFIMLLFNNVIVNIVVETVHCVCVFAMALTMLLLFRKIVIFYNPMALSSYLFDAKNPSKDRNKILAATDLIRYSCDRNNPDVYRKCKEHILRVTLIEQMTNGNKFYTFSKSLQDAFITLTNLSTDERIKPLCHDNFIAPAYYNIIAYGYNGEQNFATIWWCLTRMMESNNTEWIQQYWSAANEYYTFCIKNKSDRFDASEDIRTYNSRFLEFHHMFGVLLVYHEKYEWLHYIFSTDHVSPPKYNLIPGTFCDIVFDALCFQNDAENPWALTGKYPMRGLTNDIKSDQAILLQIYRYYALLLIRLFSYDDYNINFCDPKQMPSIGQKFTDFNKCKRIAANIKQTVSEYWYEDDRISKIHFPQKTSAEDVINLLDEYIINIDNEIKERQDHPKLDTDKFEELKRLLEECDNNTISFADAPSDEDKENGHKTSIAITIEQKIPSGICCKDGYSGWSNYPDVLCHYLNDKIERYIEGCYSFLTPVVDLQITERNFFPLLKKLQVSNDFVILSMGVYLSGIDMRYNETPVLKYDDKCDSCYYGYNRVLQRNSALSAVYIIKSNDMIKMETTEAKDNSQGNKFDGMVVLEKSKNHLYTNIGKIINEKSPSPIIKLGKPITTYTKQDIPFIRIKVKRDGDDTVELANAKTLAGYLRT